jgi:thiosulfate/3-mercaptopyruvate sulfurtransferase
MALTTLVSTDRLADHLGDPGWRIIDCRFNLSQPEAGATGYRAGHIPGALYAHLDRDLSGPVTPESGRHPLPDPAHLAATFSAWGIGPDTQVVCYDQQASAIAARLWWLLRWLGHDAVAVLDGGLKQWLAEGRTLGTDVPQVEPVAFVGEPGPGRIIDTDTLASDAASGNHLLIDVRAPERFRGEVEPLDTRAGHIPGAVNLPYAINLDANERYLPPDELKALYAPVIGSTPPDACALMCGSGVTACHSLLALEIAGIRGARLYAGSWSEWIRDPARPVAVGNAE